MKLIAKITDEDVGENILPVTEFRLRKATRAILFNENKEIAVISVAKDNYYKIPGGGVEEGEDLNIALIREIKEEAGATARVIMELGSIFEERTKYGFKQESVCFIMEVVNGGNSKFTDEERENGFSLSWMPIDKAIALFEKNKTTEYSAKFMQYRDLIFLKQAKIDLKL